MIGFIILCSLVIFRNLLNLIHQDNLVIYVFIIFLFDKFYFRYKVELVFAKAFLLAITYFNSGLMIIKTILKYSRHSG